MAHLVNRREEDAVPIVAAVIPCFRVRPHILDVIGNIGDEIIRIYVVDDACPENTGNFVQVNCRDSRVRVLRHDANEGVGGATMTGFAVAEEDGADIIVKIDGDGQMDPSLIPRLIMPIRAGNADYVKGNRFYDIDTVIGMPAIRIFGNAALSFMAKLSTGYWNLFDPTNGFVAIHAKVAGILPRDKIAKGYFFETDLLFRLNTLGAVVKEVPMRAIYGEEQSNLNIYREISRFAFGHVKNFAKRLFYNYYLRNFSMASLEVLFGAGALLFGITYGLIAWFGEDRGGEAASAGKVMLAALPTFVGIQSLLSFVNHDVQGVPKEPIHPYIEKENRPKQSSPAGREG